MKLQPQRRRVKWGLMITITLIIIAIGVGAWVKHQIQQSGPRFTPGVQVTAGRIYTSAFIMNNINLGNDRGLIAFYTKDTSNPIGRLHLMNVDLGEVLGEFDRNYSYLEMTPDGKQVLASSTNARYNLKLKQLAQEKLGLKTNTRPGPGDFIIEYWLIPLDGSPARQIAYATNYIVDYFEGTLSPNRRYYIIAMGNEGNFILDLKEGRRINWPSTPYPGNLWWWSDTELLQRNADGDLEIVEMESQRKHLLMTSGEIESFLKSHGLPTEKQETAALGVWDYHYQHNRFYYSIGAVWNGRDYYFRLWKHWLTPKPGEETWTLILDRKTESLYVEGSENAEGPNETAERVESEDDEEQWAVFMKDYGQPGCNAVYLRHTRTGAEKTLIPPDQQSPTNSFPRFVGSWIVFNQNKSVWRMRRDGTEKQQLFPPVIKPESN